MARNCGLSVVFWFVLAAVYGYLVREQPGNNKYFVVIGMASVVWFGALTIFGVRYKLRDWNARRRMARGERPQDGDLVAATGPIHPLFEPLHAPFSGRECVVYEYEVGPPRRGENNPARDYIGHGMTRCSIRTKHGELALGSFPMMEHFFETPVDRHAAFEYIANTRFEELEGVIGAVKTMVKVYTMPPPVRTDWKVGDASSSDRSTADVVEKIIAPGETVTAFGRWVAGSNAIVSDTKEKGFLRVQRGGDAQHVPAVPWGAIASFVGGAIVIAVAHLIFFDVISG